MDRKRQHCRAVTSLAFLERARAWECRLRTLPQGRDRWGKNTSLAKEGRGGSKNLTGWIEKNTKVFSFIYRALDIMIIDISKNPQDLQLQLLEKELFSTHHNDDHS